MNNPKQTDSRTGTFFLLLFILLATGIVISGYIWYNTYERNFRIKVEQQLSAVADLKVDQIEEWRKERLGDGQIFYKNDVFSAIVKRYIQNRNDRGAKNEILTWVGQVQNAYGYDLMMLLDADFNTILVFPENRERARLVIDKTNTEILRSGNIAFQDFYRNNQDQHIYLKILIPILKDPSSKRLIAVLAMRISPEKYLYPLIKKWPTPSRSAETLIIRRDGNDALFLNDLRFGKDAALNLRIPLENMDDPAVKAALGQEGIIEGVDYRGVPALACVRKVPDSPWSLVVRIDISEVYEPLRERLWLIVILAIVSLAGTGAAVGLIWRHQRNRFYREKYESAEALRNSENRYRRLFEAARDGILILDFETGMIVDVNQFLIEMLGYSHEQFLGKKIWELGFLKDIAANWDNFLELQQKDYMCYEDLPLETVHGRKIEVEFVSHVYQIDQHKVIQCNIRDITERKRAEESLRKSEAQLRAVLDATPFPIALIDVEDNNIDFWSRSALTLFGHTAPTVAEWYQIAYPDPEYRREVIDRWKPFLEKAKLSSQAVNTGEYRVACRDGSVRICELYAAFLADNLIVTFNDVTDRKRAEAEVHRLLESYERSRQALLSILEDQKQAQEALTALSSRQEALLSAVPDIVMEVNNNKVYTWANRSGIEFFGEDVIGKEAAFFFEGEQSTYGDVQPLFNGSEQILYVESWQRRKDGEKRLLAWRCKVLKDKNGNVTGALSSANDITERAKAEEEIRTLNAELEQRVLQRTAQLEEANKELEAFTYSVSHDLRAPLRAIDGFTNILLEEYNEKLDDEGKRVCTVIYESARRMGQLIDDLLSFSHVNRPELQIFKIDMKTMAHSIFFELTTPEMRQRIDFRLEDLSPASGDPTMMRQVWVNLISNAIKFSSKRERADISIEQKQENDKSLYCITDNGAGFDMKYADKLFGVFQRLHSINEFEGTGVGLAIVERIIHRHGGQVWAEGETDKGASFYFSLPS